jgi:biopolymer transport protein ExbD
VGGGRKGQAPTILLLPLLMVMVVMIVIMMVMMMSLWIGVCIATASGDTPYQQTRGGVLGRGMVEEGEEE